MIYKMVRKFQPLINRICSQLKLYFLYQTCDQDREYVLYIIMQKKNDYRLKNFRNIDEILSDLFKNSF